MLINLIDCGSKVGFTPEGRIVVLEIDLYSNGGCTLDFTEMVSARSMVKGPAFM